MKFYSFFIWCDCQPDQLNSLRNLIKWVQVKDGEEKRKTRGRFFTNGRDENTHQCLFVWATPLSTQSLCTLKKHFSPYFFLLAGLPFVCLSSHWLRSCLYSLQRKKSTFPFTLLHSDFHRLSIDYCIGKNVFFSCKHTIFSPFFPRSFWNFSLMKNFFLSFFFSQRESFHTFR